MKKLIGLYDTKTMSPEQIYETAVKNIQERDRLELIQMAKNRADEKTTKTHKTTNSIKLPIIKRISIKLRRLLFV